MRLQSTDGRPNLQDLIVRRRQAETRMARLRITLILFSVVYFTGTLQAAKPNTVVSPNGQLKVIIECGKGQLHYSFIIAERRILEPSLISIIKDASYQVTGARIEKIDTTAISSVRLCGTARPFTKTQRIHTTSRIRRATAFAGAS